MGAYNTHANAGAAVACCCSGRPQEHGDCAAPQSPFRRNHEAVLGKGPMQNVEEKMEHRRSVTLKDADTLLSGFRRTKVVTMADVPDAGALAEWLREHDLGTDEWGVQAGSKSVASYWKELKNQEASLELWTNIEGKTKPVRVTHVLRAKVSSEKAYESNFFLMNTWQQFANGSKRSRNGLLSEKLMVTEVPDRGEGKVVSAAQWPQLNEVCCRALNEEMGFLTDSSFNLSPHQPAPEFDPTYTCPLKVVRTVFTDRQKEVMTGSSYPDLITVYHLYTVDIICVGLPCVDFNTIEFDRPDENGHRKLKYVHAWSWLEWHQIQRILLEGSTLKDQKTCGSFLDEEDLRAWLGQFKLDLRDWGAHGNKSVRDLFNELETQESHLEIWSRHDGVRLLVRVCYVVDLMVTSSEPELQGKHLFQAWKQVSDGRIFEVNRYMSRKLRVKNGSCIEMSLLMEAAQEAIFQQLAYLEDVHYRLHSDRLPTAGDMLCSKFALNNPRFKEHRFVVEESPTFKGMITLYNKYTVEAMCQGLPKTDFVSLDFSRSVSAKGWRWLTFEKILDNLHTACGRAYQDGGDARVQKFEEGLEGSADSLAALSKIAHKLEGRGDDQLVAQLQSVVAELGDQLADLQAMCASADDLTSRSLPPDMVSKKHSEGFVLKYDSGRRLISY